MFVAEGVYHVYNRLARGERVFDEEGHARLFVDALVEVARRDELTILAWCLMSNHFHLAVRTGAVPLARPLRSLQQKVTRGVNLQRRVWGPLWQGRYRAKLVTDQSTLAQVLAYIHLNPAAAGTVEDPAEYRWSGHRELLGRVRNPVIDVDEVLAWFGRTRRSARAAYLRRVSESSAETWAVAEPGRLPWWHAGRPPSDDEGDPEATVRARRRRGSEGAAWRPRLSAGEFLARGAQALGVPLGELQGRRRSEPVLRGRELLALVGVERWGLRVKDVAGGLEQAPDTVTKAIGRAARRRAEEPTYRREMDELDRAVAAMGLPAPNDNGGST